MKLVVVLLNYNDYKTSEYYLNLVKDYKSIGHIVVVDNASTDGSYEELKKFECNKISVIRSEINSGYAAGNNIGIKYAIDKFYSEYICISNPDIEVKNDTFDQIMNFIGLNKHVGIVSGKAYRDETHEIISSWKSPSYIICLLEQLYVLKRFFKGITWYDKAYLNASISPAVDVVSGCFFFIRANVFQEIGLFDEDTFLYYEENILAQKLKAHGYQNYILNHCSYIHHEHVSIEKNLPQWSRRAKISYDSRSVYCKKYLHANWIQLKLLKLTFYLGKIEYLLFDKIRNRVNKWE